MVVCHGYDDDVAFVDVVHDRVRYIEKFRRTKLVIEGASRTGKSFQPFPRTLVAR